MHGTNLRRWWLLLLTLALWAAGMCVIAPHVKAITQTCTMKRWYFAGGDVIPSTGIVTCTFSIELGSYDKTSGLWTYNWAMVFSADPLNANQQYGAFNFSGIASSYTSNTYGTFTLAPGAVKTGYPRYIRGAYDGAHEPELDYGSPLSQYQGWPSMVVTGPAAPPTQKSMTVQLRNEWDTVTTYKVYQGGTLVATKQLQPGSALVFSFMTFSDGPVTITETPQGYTYNSDTGQWSSTYDPFSAGSERPLPGWNGVIPVDGATKSYVPDSSIPPDHHVQGVVSDGATAPETDPKWTSTVSAALDAPTYREGVNKIVAKIDSLRTSGMSSGTSSSGNATISMSATNTKLDTLHTDNLNLGTALGNGTSAGNVTSATSSMSDSAIASAHTAVSGSTYDNNVFANDNRLPGQATVTGSVADSDPFASLPTLQFSNGQSFDVAANRPALKVPWWGEMKTLLYHCVLWGMAFVWIKYSIQRSRDFTERLMTAVPPGQATEGVLLLVPGASGLRAAVKGGVLVGLGIVMWGVAIGLINTRIGMLPETWSNFFNVGVATKGGSGTLAGSFGWWCTILPVYAFFEFAASSLLLEFTLWTGGAFTLSVIRFMSWCVVLGMLLSAGSSLRAGELVCLNAGTAPQRVEFGLVAGGSLFFTAKTLAPGQSTVFEMPSGDVTIDGIAWSAAGTYPTFTLLDTQSRQLVATDSVVTCEVDDTYRFRRPWRPEYSSSILWASLSSLAAIVSVWVLLRFANRAASLAP